MQNLLIATTNQGKVEEFKQLLSGFPINVKNLTDFEKIPEPVEDGKTFAENAELKASYYALNNRYFALADDSGLEVEAIDNEPGIYSARYSGKNATDLSNIEKLLENLDNKKNRKARFVCEMAIANKEGKIIYNANGVCDGVISHKPCGNNGFGYDPVFVPSGYTETFGELSSEIKQQISHRSKAVKQIITFLSTFRSS